MTNTDLLSRFAARVVTPQIRPYTFFVGRWLPQLWVFTTESGSSTLVVEKTGEARGVPGASKSPDVTVRWTDAQLDAALTVALTNGDRSRIPRSPPPEVVAHTQKGSDALRMMGERLGLAQ